MKIGATVKNLQDNLDTFKDAARIQNASLLWGLLGPAARGFLAQVAKGKPGTTLRATTQIHFDWTYERDRPELARLFAAAKRSQWDADTALDWRASVDAADPDHDLMPEEFLPFATLPAYRKATRAERDVHKRDYMSWTLSQFLHGEQGALMAAAQVAAAVRWMDGKLYASTQVMDEGRHVDVFDRYLEHKLRKRYEINDNLYVILDSVMSDARWDMKFLGMQIMIEGLALGAFGTIRARSREPLLRELLRYVITDEARHVHFGVLAIAEHFTQLSDRERRERQDWAYELTLLLRNRFLLQEFYEEHFAHAMTRREWDRALLASSMMEEFRRAMFRRIVPNLKRIGLLPERLRAHYEEIGLLGYESGKAAPDLTADELLAD